MRTLWLNDTFAEVLMLRRISLLAMMYTRGPNRKNEFDVKLVQHAARVGEQAGRGNCGVSTGSVESFREVGEGCFVPVVIAGGVKIVHAISEIVHRRSALEEKVMRLEVRE